MIKLTRPLVFIDLEATGLNILNDKIVEYCFFKVMPDMSSITLYDRVNPGINIPKNVSKIHNIYDEDVKDKKYFIDHSKKIFEFIYKCDLAGYNCNRFDIPLLTEEFSKVNIDFDINNHKVIDVQNIFHKMEQRTLSAAYKFYCKKELKNAHSAIIDSKVTYEVLLSQISYYKDIKIKDKEGQLRPLINNNVHDLSSFTSTSNRVDLAGKIVYDINQKEIFNFGKYLGQSVELVLKNNPQYYNWILKSNFPHNTKKVITKIKLKMK
ncbi:MAG: 3'-5' exonuclease [Bacteroides sp.]|nr:MAG: 3'-5' exonuclease [Bacteroides sp.]